MGPGRLDRILEEEEPQEEPPEPPDESPDEAPGDRYGEEVEVKGQEQEAPEQRHKSPAREKLGS